MLKNIRHIILDLGGVLLNIDYKRTETAFEKIGLTTFKNQYVQSGQSELFSLFETGKINEDEFIATLKTFSNQKLSDAQIKSAWNAMLLDFPLRRLQILQQLQLHFDLFLLSNTNVIHEESFNKILKTQTSFDSLAVFFDRVYYSHRIGLRKPDKAFFELILNQNNLKPEKTLFVDDSIQHIEAAKNLGIQTIHLEKGMSMEYDIFKTKK